MPKIVVVVDAKGIQRCADIMLDGVSVNAVSTEMQMRDLKSWVGHDSLTFGQVETLVRLFNGGVSLEVAEDGLVTVQPVRKLDS